MPDNAADFALARRNMVDSQIRTKDVTDPRVIRAFDRVPREKFLAAELAARAYIDEDVRVLVADEGGMDRYVMEPVPLAALLQLADLNGDDIVLDVGCATGYSTALLSLLCSSVVALECDERLAEWAGDALSDGGYDNAAVVVGPLEKGWPAEAPYDVIVLGGAVEWVPQHLTDQLREGGRLVCVEGQGLTGEACLYLKRGGVVGRRPSFNAAVQPLPGFQREAAFVF